MLYSIEQRRLIRVVAYCLTSSHEERNVSSEKHNFEKILYAQLDQNVYSLFLEQIYVYVQQQQQ